MTSRYEVDMSAVAAAARALGLRHPVRVFIRRYTWGDGRYIGFVDGEHRVGVASDLSARRASRTLWHELTHALQVERLGDERTFWSLWWKQMRKLGLSRTQAARATSLRYRRAPLEAEAYRNERRHASRALTRPRRRPRRLWRWSRS